jgi:hypothetical protein
MGHEHRIWRLIAAKMTGEATPEELMELRFLSQEDPKLQDFLQTLDALWQDRQELTPHQAEQAFARHMQRLEQKTDTAKRTAPERRPHASKSIRRKSVGHLPRLAVFNRAILESYFKVITRNLTRFKGFASINIAGLPIGLASAILILLWIRNEYSIDQFHAKKDRIYVLYNRATVSPPGRPKILTRPQFLSQPFPHRLVI